MRCSPFSFLAVLAALLAMPAPAGAAGKQTVCTITVNSADEKEALRRHLPESKFRFVELVERHRSTWLESACRQAISCDVLVISGHYDGGNQFFSDRLDVREYLPVDELERVSCSDSCPGLLSRLKEVHLYGCNTLNAEAQSSASAEVGRALARDGVSPKQAQQRVRAMNAGLGESSRDRMRQIFKDVPVIYGFSSVAPLGPTAAGALSGYLRAGGASEVGSGRASSRLLAHFSAFGMTVARGITDHDPQAAVRRDVCRFADDRASDANKLNFVHEMLQRRLPELGFHLDRVERQLAALDDPARRTPEVAQVMTGIAADADTRGRVMQLARDADLPAVRARMLRMAGELGWLAPADQRQELATMFAELHARKSIGLTEVDLACSLNPQHELDGAIAGDGAAMASVAHAALRACLGHADARARTLQALLSTHEADVQIARSYLRLRPVTEPAEWRRLAAEIVRMPAANAQVRALEALGGQHLSDRQTLDTLMRLYTQTSSWAVQAAVAGILIRADQPLKTRPELVSTLVKDRRPSPPGDNMIDALIRRLQTS